MKRHRFNRTYRFPQTQAKSPPQFACHNDFLASEFIEFSSKIAPENRRPIYTSINMEILSLPKHSVEISINRAPTGIVVTSFHPPDLRSHPNGQVISAYRSHAQYNHNCCLQITPDGWKMFFTIHIIRFPLSNDAVPVLSMNSPTDDPSSSHGGVLIARTGNHRNIQLSNRPPRLLATN